MGSFKPNFALIGMPGSGKSTIGRLASKASGLLFFDSDELIEQRIGMPISAIFKEKGERFFRDLEASVIEGLLKAPNSIIALGGGAAVFHERIIKQSEITKAVWVKRSIDNIISTLEIGKRPLIKDEADIRSLYLERSGAYGRVADYTITNDQNVEGAIEQLSQILNQWSY